MQSSEPGNPPIVESTRRRRRPTYLALTALLLVAVATIIAIVVVMLLANRPGMDAVGAHRAALRRLHETPQIVELLGRPIEADSFWQVKMSADQRDDGRTVARLDSPIRGPRGTGRIEFVAIGRRNRWEFEHLVVWIDGRPEPIVLEP